MPQISEEPFFTQVHAFDQEGLENLNRWIRYATDEMQKTTGQLGDPEIYRALSMTGQRVMNAADPVEAQDLVTLSYVEGNFIGIPKASTDNVPSGRPGSTGGAAPIGPPVLALESGEGEFIISFTPPDNPDNLAVVGYELFFKINAGFTSVGDSDGNKAVVAINPDRVIEEVFTVAPTNYADQFFFRARTKLSDGTTSMLSDQVAGFVLRPPGEGPRNIGKPDPPAVAVLANGGRAGQFWFLLGLGYEPARNNIGGVTKAQIQVATQGAAFTATNDDAFSSGIVFDNEVARPDSIHDIQVVDPGRYQFTARLYSEPNDEWSDWQAPVEADTLSGSLDTDVPGALTSLVVTPIAGDPLGNSVLIRIVEPTTNAKTIWAYDIQIQSSPFTASTVDTTGILDVLGAGQVQIADSVDIGGDTLTDNSAIFAPGALAGLTLYIANDALPNSEAAIRNPMSYVIASNTATTITINTGADGKNTFRRPTIDTPVYIITNGFKTVATGELLVRDVKIIPFGELVPLPGSNPDREVFERRLILTQPGYIKVRAHNKHGLGPTVYWDGSTGSTTTGNQVLFTPGQILGEAIGDEEILAQHLAPDAVISDKIADLAVIQDKLSVAGKLVDIPTDMFSAPDRDTVAWAAKTIQAGGQAYSITGGSTGNMLGATYVYWSGGTAFTATSILTQAHGEGKQLVAYCRPAPDPAQKASFVVASNLFINAEHISASSISAITIQADAITSYLVLGEEIASALSGRRFRLNASELAFYDSGGVARAAFGVTTDNDLGFLQFSEGATKAAQGGVEWLGTSIVYSDGGMHWDPDTHNADDFDFGAGLPFANRWANFNAYATNLYLEGASTLTANSLALTLRSDSITLEDASLNGLLTLSPSGAQFSVDITIHEASNPRLRISEGGSATSYVEIEDANSANAALRKVTASGAPVIDLDPVASDGVSASQFRFFRNVNTSGSKQINFHKGDGTSTVRHTLRSDLCYFFGDSASSGNVGIGTTTPALTGASNVLHIAGTAPALRLQETDAGAGDFSWLVSGGELTLKRSATAQRTILSGGGELIGWTSTDVSLSTGDCMGKLVGALHGTLNSYGLSVSAYPTTAVWLHSFKTGTGTAMPIRMVFDATEALEFFRSGSIGTIDSPNGDLALYAGGSEVCRLDDSANTLVVGFTTDPFSHAGGILAASAIISASSSSANSSFVSLAQVAASGFASVQAGRIGTGAKLGMRFFVSDGNAAGSIDIAVGGQVKMNDLGTTTGATPIEIDGSNNLLRNTSSRQFKENIRDILPDDAALLAKLRPRRFRGKSDGIERLGMIAEEVFEASEDLSLLFEGRPENWSRDGVIALLVAEVQALRSQLQKLSSEAISGPGPPLLG